MRILNLYRKFLDKFDDPANHLLRVELDSTALLSNISSFRNAYPNHKIAAVLKSNAYGHGLKEIGLALAENNDIKYFAVDSIIEAEKLHDLGIKKPVIILGYIPRKVFYRLKRFSATPVINSLEDAKYFSKAGFLLNAQIKLDTGMNRQGIKVSELKYALEILARCKKINLTGLLTHLADADGATPEGTLLQLQSWTDALKIFRDFKGNSAEFDLHFSASAATKYLASAESNLIRAGIGIYGFNLASNPALNLKPVLSFWAKLVNIKTAQKGEKIGYNFTFEADKKMRVGILPCGYYEGLPRELSNQGFVYYGNQPLRILGRISMNLTAVDLTDAGEIKIEDDIEVYSSDLARLNSIENAARIANTIPYEILVRINPGIRRYVK
ncbi:alanine racemase [Candidatus Giovannonibacteria bacterium]|nr:alanine racemase [Candidatus Giovannonibacteria bacterium]